MRRAVVLIPRGGRLLMVRRTGALLDGLWEPPGVELSPHQSARAALAAELERLGVRAKLENTKTLVRHTITHRVIEVEVWRGELKGPWERRPRAVRAVDARGGGTPLTGLAIKLLKRGTR